MLCSVEDCQTDAASRGWCQKHYARWKRHGDPLHSAHTGWHCQDGYVRMRMPGHPNAAKNGYMFEHRYIMSEHLGRPLLPTETVHHKNGDRGDNRVENLELCVTTHARGQRVEDRVADALDILQRYAPQRLVVGTL